MGVCHDEAADRVKDHDDRPAVESEETGHGTGASCSRRPARPPSRGYTAADIPRAVHRRVVHTAGVVFGPGYEARNALWIWRLSWGVWFGRTCMDCGTRMIFAMQEHADREVWPILASIDHVRQKSQGGRNHPHNFQVVCATCNNLRQLDNTPIPAATRETGRARLEAARRRAARAAYGTRARRASPGA